MEVLSPTVDRPAIRAAERLIRPHVRRTPTLQVAGSDFGLGGDLTLVFKLEFLQHSGSFKSRGAFTNLLSRDVPEVGVVAASGGNHGAAVAFAAQNLGIKAKVFVPEVASPAKIAQIRSYGADLVVGGDRYADALAASEDWTARTGAMPIHAFDQIETLRGQGTTALEIEAAAPDLDALLVAVGGGGLIGGIAAWYAGAPGPTRVVGVEPEASPTLTNALAAGEPVDAPAGGLAADSLAPRRVGDLMFPIARDHVADVVLISDEAIAEAQKTLWRVLRVVAEPGGAAAFAALQSGCWRPNRGARVGVLLCGANTTAVDFDR